MDTECSGQDIRLRDVSRILKELHRKFSDNFNLSAPHMGAASVVEIHARKIWESRAHLEKLARQIHQQQLVTYLDEIFGDSLCACYSAMCGLHIPARALFRRCLELGLAIVCYWDSPVNFWGWRDHDEDISFSALLDTVKSRGFQTMCDKLEREDNPDLAAIGKTVQVIYRDLSNVVHPKPQLFATRVADAYSYHPDQVVDTLGLGAKMQTCLCELLTARFPELNLLPPSDGLS